MSKSKPIGIRYYQLFNHGVGIIIYHQLVLMNNTAVWDTRFQGGGTSLIIGNSQVLDLADTTLRGEVFYLGANTFWGADFSDKSQAFTYNPRSNLMASATRVGSAQFGGVVYQGVKEYPAASGGTVSWLAIALAAACPLALLACLRFRRYKLRYRANDRARAAIGFELGGNNSNKRLPEPTRTHWSEDLKKPTK